MFEYLDDPDGTPSTDRLRTEVHRTGRRRRRARRAAWGSAAVVVVVLTSVVGVVAYADRRLGDVDRIDGATTRPEPAAREPPLDP